MEKSIHVIHTSPGRTRLRLPWLRRAGKVATSLADDLLLVEGISEVQVRPFTGSVLCMHDPEEIDVDRLLEEVRRSTGVDTVVRPGEELPDGDALLRSLEEGSGVARAASSFIKGLNVELLRATEGHVDLGALTALGFAAAGVMNVAVKGRLEAPPWFSLGWWAFRTFATMEELAIRSTPAQVRHDSGDAPPHGKGPPGASH
ncbi:hypothetical protein D7X30_33485 [Corallococcus sp. AB011P]|uniref:HMA2 domain-containing protein n=1 Tax=unclassified Corallococcus TaxID=2685029 RepID=UPI000EA3D2FC|nr:MULTISPECIES: hypothetical protein [unclassified Corallococcus]RKG52521.1 hypothetical protein D7X30_33485 [Corallococcus sp. AB011P]RKH88117.1 hypothetical protein D7Y21_16325 [Corallococcus sp. AB045]